jgi:ribonuclease P protein component
MMPAMATAGTPSLRFGRVMRLKHTRDFARLKAQGRRLVQGSLIANWEELPVGARPRLGVVTSRKLGGAVVRSRARRLLREVFRQHQHDFRRPVALVMVARASIVGTKLAEVERDFLSAMRRAHLLRPVA